MSMIILIEPNVAVMANLGQQPIIADQNYRFMKYCLITNYDNGKLIFNGLTRSLVYLHDSELNNIGNINDYEFLYKYYFLVTEDFNEFKMTNEIRNKFMIPIDTVYLDHPTSFTILTTTKCNARCFYCYELHSKGKKHMSEETAQKVAEYIHKVAPINKTINLSWFGGEPLYNMKVIDLIDNYLRGQGRSFTNTITTNGYLFTKEVATKAKNLWNLVEAQITIDGTEHVYNKTKNYVYIDKVNPYKKILNNIAILLNLGIHVSIRMNADLYNVENLKQLIQELHKRYGNHPNLTLYVWPIFEEGDYTRSKEDHIKLFEEIKKLDDLIAQLGYFVGTYPNSDLPSHQCMADSGDSVLISPTGELGTCEHLIDSNFWGHIDDPSKKNYEELNKWRVYNPPLDICNDCAFYPSCIRPTYCNEMGKCDEQYKEWRLDKAIRGIVYAYNNRNGNVTNMLFPHLSENVV